MEKRNLFVYCLGGAIALLSCMAFATVDDRGNMDVSVMGTAMQDEEDAGQETASAASVPGRSGTGYEEYAEVLLGHESFFDTAAGHERGLGDYKQPLFFQSELLNSRYHFFLLDIDHDGTEEVFLEYDGLGSTLVLRYEDGLVYGYPFKGNEMGYVSIDGSFMRAIEESGWSRIRFSHGGYELIPTANLDFQSEGTPERHPFSEEDVMKVFLPDRYEGYQMEKEGPPPAIAWDESEERRAFKAVLSGNATLIEDLEVRRRFQRDIGVDGTSTWRYVLQDFNQDGREDLFIQYDPSEDDTSALLYYQDGKVVCAFSDTMDYHDFYYPLTDGRLLYVDGYGVTTDECIQKVNPDFTLTSETDYQTVSIGYDYYSQQRFEDYFSKEYEVVKGVGEYYFVKEFHEETGCYDEEANLTREERIEVEQMMDRLLMPDSAWRYCSELEAQDSAYNRLRRIFREQADVADDDFCDFFCIDFSRDGHESAFVFSGTNYAYEDAASIDFSGSLWYVDEQGCTLLSDRIQTDAYEASIVWHEDEIHLLYSINHDGNPPSSDSYLWAVRDGQPDLVYQTPKYCYLREGGLALADTFLEAGEDGGTEQGHRLDWDADGKRYKERR